MLDLLHLVSGWSIPKQDMHTILKRTTNGATLCNVYDAMIRTVAYAIAGGSATDACHQARGTHGPRLARCLGGQGGKAGGARVAVV